MYFSAPPMHAGVRISKDLSVGKGKKRLIGVGVTTALLHPFPRCDLYHSTRTTDSCYSLSKVIRTAAIPSILSSTIRANVCM